MSIRPDQFETVVAALDGELRRLLRARGWREDEVEDLLQETWWRGWEKRHQFTARGSLAGWLRRICRTVCREELTNRRRTRDLGLGMNEPAVPDSLERAVERDHRDDDRLSLIMQMPDRRRTTVLLHYVEGMSVSEVAEHLDCAPGTVRATLYQARQKLRELDQSRGSPADS